MAPVTTISAVAPPAQRRAGASFSVVLLAAPASPLAARVGRAMSSAGARAIHVAPTAPSALTQVPPPPEAGVGVICEPLAAESIRELVAALRSRGWRRIAMACPDTDPATIRTAIAARIRCLVRRPAAQAAVPAQRTHGSAPDLDLSKREVQVLQAVADGRTNNEVGALLGLSGLTVKSHLARIGRKAGTGDRAQMVAVAMRAGLVT